MLHFTLLRMTDTNIKYKLNNTYITTKHSNHQTYRFTGIHRFAQDLIMLT